MAHPACSCLIVVVNPNDRAVFEQSVQSALPHRPVLVDGSTTRDGSVRAGLAAIPPDADYVLIHDAARPLVTHAVIDRVLSALASAAGAAPALAVSDALWTGHDGVVTGTQDRTGLFRAQTPQGFRCSDILAAHQSAFAKGLSAADDVEVARAHGLDVAIVAGDENNLKITTPEDFARAEVLLHTQEHRS
ncbi:UNVERIFIED_CONTAM: hypothetical protein GTU68_021296 [Idotea baltica]|nr:hypothetical protein [Idotea baltica]